MAQSKAEQLKYWEDQEEINAAFDINGMVTGFRADIFQAMSQGEVKSKQKSDGKE